MVQFNKGEEIKAELDWKNLTDSEQEWGIGCSLIRPDGSVADLPLKTGTAGPNAETTTSWTRTKDTTGRTIFDQKGNYDIICKIWDKTEPPLEPEDVIESTPRIKGKITVEKAPPTPPIPIEDIIKIAGLGIGESCRNYFQDF